MVALGTAVDTVVDIDDDWALVAPIMPEKTTSAKCEHPMGRVVFVGVSSLYPRCPGLSTWTIGPVPSDRSNQTWCQPKFREMMSRSVYTRPEPGVAIFRCLVSRRGKTYKRELSTLGRVLKMVPVRGCMRGATSNGPEEIPGRGPMLPWRSVGGYHQLS